MSFTQANDHVGARESHAAPEDHKLPWYVLLGLWADATFWCFPPLRSCFLAFSLHFVGFWLVVCLFPFLVGCLVLIGFGLHRICLVTLWLLYWFELVHLMICLLKKPDLGGRIGGASKTRHYWMLFLCSMYISTTTLKHLKPGWDVLRVESQNERIG